MEFETSKKKSKKVAESKREERLHRIKVGSSYQSSGGMEEGRERKEREGTLGGQFILFILPGAEMCNNVLVPFYKALRLNLG